MGMAKKKQGKEETVIDEKALVERCKRLKALAKEVRQKTDWEWTVRNLFIRGYHFASYNRSTNTVTFSTRTGVRIPVNLIKAHMRGVRNQVTSFRPKWEVGPDLPTEQSRENAKYSGKILDSIYETGNIKRKIKDLVNDSLWSSIGIWELGISEDKKKDIVITSVDPFEWYIDPNTRSPDLNDPVDGAEFVLKSVLRPLEAIKKNPKYKHLENLEELEADSRTSESDYKRFLDQVRSRSEERAQKDNETKIVNEMYLRERDENGKIQIRVVTFVDGVDDPLQNEIIGDEYPFEIFQGEVNPRSVYSESWIKDLIPINRVINALESHIFEYNHLFAKGRFVIDKNSGVRLIVNQHGQIIEKNRGSQVNALPVPPLPSTPFDQLASMRRNFEDLSGVHDVSLGRIPTAAKSGVAIAELKQADSTNQGDLVDNLEDFLSRVGRRILKIASKNWTTAKLISVTGYGAEPELFVAISQDRIKDRMKRTYTVGSTNLPLAVIGADNQVTVKIGSWLAYTKQARQEQLKELYRIGAIDAQTLLEHLEFGEIDTILERTRREQILSIRGQQPSRSVERQFGIELDERSIAMSENELMLEGNNMPVKPEDDHDVHLAEHITVQNNKEYGDIVRVHMQEHVNMKRWLAKMQSQPLPAEGEAGGAPQGAGGAPPIPAVQPMPPIIGAGAATTTGGMVPATPQPPFPV